MKRLLGIAFVAVVTFASASAQERRSVLIRTAQPYDAIVRTIEAAGGRVTHRFTHIAGIAADVPDAALQQIEQIVGADNISRDDIIAMPEIVDPRGGVIDATLQADNTVLLESAHEAAPSNYTFNALHTNAASLHGEGYTGAGIVIAVIDSGFRPVMTHVAPSRVISPGINLVPGATEPPAVSDLNVPHGTFVAGMAAANRAFCFSSALRFAHVAAHYGAAFLHPACPAGTYLVPMVGSAPEATILPIKVFAADGGGSPTSRTIAAMERVIDLRRKYDAGEAGGYNIQVVNLSLGGATSAAARTLSDQAVEAVLNANILPVIAAGNDGFSSVTTGSPSTSWGALAVGAASGPQHEHIFRAQFSAPCATAPLNVVVQCAQLWRPDMNVQMSDFSSRGPTHDGRMSPHVVAYGSNNFSQGSGATAGTVNFGGGTSYATPTVSGIAAALRQAVPAATARQVRNAIMMTADPARIPTATEHDHGFGFVDAAAALTLLQDGDVPDTYDVTNFTRNLQANLARAGRKVHSGSVSLRFVNVRPGEVTDVPFMVHANTERLHVRIHGISPELPIEEQNPFFTDDVFLRIQSSAVHRRDRRVGDSNGNLWLLAGEEGRFTFERPEEGIWRVTPTGDWTNAGRVSYTVDIWAEKEPWPEHTAKGKVNFGDSHEYLFDVPAGAERLDARLTWMNMNGSYPISDVDVILTPPTGSAVNSCNTGRAPELCSVASPAAGTWKATVVGFSVPTFGTPGGREDYTLRITIDGNVVKPKK